MIFFPWDETNSFRDTDKERIQKSLKTSHPAGPPVILRKFETTQDEAAYIAYEVKRAIAYSGNTLNFNDFAILLRYNALSRNVEAALQSAGIPSRMIGGHKFFDRAEVKDVLAYLQLADNPSYTRKWFYLAFHYALLTIELYSGFPPGRQCPEERCRRQDCKRH